MLLYLTLYLLCVRIGEISHGSNRTYFATFGYYLFVNDGLLLFFTISLRLLRSIATFFGGGGGNAGAGGIIPSGFPTNSTPFISIDSQVFSL